ncbi:MAG: gluconokinase [Enterobacteriaceae bacterium]
MAGSSIIVMGVCASGKSTVGVLLAQKLGRKFIDGDDLHPRANIDKMASGQPLDDHDRQPWLERIRDACYSLENKSEHGVIVCSALKKSYRDHIRAGNQHVLFLFLDGDKELIMQRMQRRQGHFMKQGMVESQFKILERPDDEPDCIIINIDCSVAELVERAIDAVQQHKEVSA